MPDADTAEIRAARLLLLAQHGTDGTPTEDDPRRTAFSRFPLDFGPLAGDVGADFLGAAVRKIAAKLLDHGDPDWHTALVSSSVDDFGRLVVQVSAKINE